MDNLELKYLKKYYGENFAKFCRANFPTLLEKEGLLKETISSLFAPSRFLYEDITKNCLEGSFRNYVLNKATSSHPEIEKNLIPDNSNETPYEIMEKVGYKLYKCETNNDVQSYKKYWAKGEELCTFTDPSRINEHHIYFAIKSNADKLKRDEFKNPERQDTYGTSVISLQFSKDKYGFLSIKNRYNHSVGNPDATFSNDLENIAHGLTYSFAKELDIDLKTTYNGFEIPKYVYDKTGKLYPYNLEINNVYYCPDNIVISNGTVKQYDKSKYELIEHFLIDKESKTVTDLNAPTTDPNSPNPKSDYFAKLYSKYKKANITIENGMKKIEFTDANGLTSTLTTNSRNEIIGYSNPHLVSVGNRFLSEGKKLFKLDLPNLKSVDNEFLANNKALIKLQLPNLKTVKNDFMRYNNTVKKLDLPNLTNVGSEFMFFNTSVVKVDLPNLKTIGDNFFYLNKRILSLYLPSVEEIGNNFLHDNFRLLKVQIPNVKKIGNDFLYNNKTLSKLSTPKLEETGYNFLFNNTALNEFSFDSLRYISSGFLHDLDKGTLKKIYNIVNSNQTKNFIDELESVTTSAFSK